MKKLLSALLAMTLMLTLAACGGNGDGSGGGDAAQAPDLQAFYEDFMAGLGEEAPAMIATFLESYDFAGKTIVPFCTSSSDSIDNSLHIFTELCPDATIAQALTANNEADIQPWLQELGLL